MDNDDLCGKTFNGLVDTVEKIVSDDESFTQHPDQDHNLIDLEDPKVFDEDKLEVDILSARIESLEVGLKEKETLLIENDAKLVTARIEASRLENENEKLEYSLKGKDENNEVLTAQANSLEESKKSLETKLKTWGAMIRKLNLENKELKHNNPKENEDDHKK